MSGKFIIPAPGHNPIVKWPVWFTYPNESGTTTKFKLIAKFEILNDEDMDKIINPPAPDAPEDDAPRDNAGLTLIRQAAARQGSDKLLMKHVLKDLDGFEREDAPDAGFDDDVFDYVMGQPAIKSALVNAYIACRQGRVEKN